MMEIQSQQGEREGGRGEVGRWEGAGGRGGGREERFLYLWN